jgi:hypothetical protein
MKRKRLYLAIQSIVCILLALLLIAAVVDACRDGIAARAEDPLAPIFSREIAAERLLPLAPLFFAAAALTAVGLILGVKDGSRSRAVKSGKVENRSVDGKTLRVMLLVAAAALILAGLLSGSARDVFAKAVKICTECVGLG